MEVEMTESLKVRLEEAKKMIRERRVPLWLLADKELFELEQEKIFSKSWLFLGHESEIPNSGDYMRRYLGSNVSVILTRDKSGEIRGFYNVCPHRGAKIIKEDRGNSQVFRCPYHGLTFKNSGQLIGIPASRLIAPDLDKKSICLFPLRIELLHGMIFGNMDDTAPSLENSLGDMKFYLDILTNRTEQGLQFSTPQRWIIKANWKTAVDNFIGDGWHFLTAHGWAYEVGDVVPKGNNLFSAYAGIVKIKGGHGVMFAGPRKEEMPNYPRPSYYPVWWPELLQMAKSRLTNIEYKVWTESNRLIGNVFPNLAFHNTAYGAGLSKDPIPYQSFRLWRPIDVDKTEIWTWFAVEKEAPQKLKELSFKTYIRLFGSSGVVESDDIVIWESTTENSMSSAGKKFQLFYFAGMHETPDYSYEGPGEYYYGGNNEINQLNFFEEYINKLLW